jgi:ABC-type transport system involved in multi-copper enzyme maturation permease subunit
VIDEEVLRAQLLGLGGGLRAELRKLYRRPAVWILLGIALAIHLLLSYFLNWLLITHPIGGGVSPADPVLAKRMLYPAQFVANSVNAGNLSGALALILGVLVVGSEYGWGTYKTLLTQRPARSLTVLAKVGALLIALGCGTLLFFLLGAFCSVVIAILDGQPLNHWTAFGTIVKAVLASWLTWSWWSLFGAMLAYLFRQSALPIGLGLAYRFVIEGLVLGLGGAAGGQLVHNLSKGLPGPNADALGEAFQGLTKPAIGAGQATIVLILYSVAAVVISGVVISRRDVT